MKAAQNTELALRKERRELEEQKQALELTVDRRLDEERNKIREAAKKEAADERQFKDAEKDKLINDMRAKIEEQENFDTELRKEETAIAERETEVGRREGRTRQRT